MLSGASNQKAVAPSDRVSGTNCLRKNCRRWLNRRWMQNAGETHPLSYSSILGLSLGQTTAF